MGVEAVPFVKMHKPKVQSLQRYFGEYIKDLHRIKGSRVPPIGATLTEEANKLSVKTTHQGFPILPDVELANLKKEDLEHLM
jgi:hypothetical protein